MMPSSGSKARAMGREPDKDLSLSRLENGAAPGLTVAAVSENTTRTLSATSAPLRLPDPGTRIRRVGRKGAFKDRPLWRRLQTIHHEIKEGRHPNTSSLAKQLSVSSKTVQRDIDYLRDELDAPIQFVRDENGYAYSRD